MKKLTILLLILIVLILNGACSLSAPHSPQPSVHDWPDLSYEVVDCKPFIMFDNSSPDYRNWQLLVGIANNGKISTGNFVVSLSESTNELCNWNIDELAPGNRTLMVTLNEIFAKDPEFRPGKKHLSVKVDTFNQVSESDEFNNHASADVVLAREPIPLREPSSELEAIVQESVANFTWYDSTNQNELIEIMKEVFKDFMIDWSKIQFQFLNFNEFNESYARATGITWEDAANYGLAINGMSKPLSQQIYLKEGILLQLLIVSCRELGLIYQVQTDFEPYLQLSSESREAGEFALSLFESYGLSILKERYSFDGLINASYDAQDLLEDKIFLVDDEKKSKSMGTSIRLRLWLIAREGGYPEGNAPSEFWLNAYNKFIYSPDHVAYLRELDEAAKSLDIESIKSVIYWRLCDKEPTIIPPEIIVKLNPLNKYQDLTFDDVLVSQSLYRYP